MGISIGTKALPDPTTLQCVNCFCLRKLLQAVSNSPLLLVINEVSLEFLVLISLV